MSDILDRLRGNVACNFEQARLDAIAEIERLRAGGCARDQNTTQFCAEAARLAKENAELREAVGRLGRECRVFREVLSRATNERFFWSAAWKNSQQTALVMAIDLSDADPTARAAIEGATTHAGAGEREDGR